MKTTWKLFCRLRGADTWACISPATLKFNSRQDAETVAERYRQNDIQRGNGKSEFAVFQLDDYGYIVITN
jgi:hypothetical protein